MLDKIPTPNNAKAKKMAQTRYIRETDEPDDMPFSGPRTLSTPKDLGKTTMMPNG